MPPKRKFDVLADQISLPNDLVLRQFDYWAPSASPIPSAPSQTVTEVHEFEFDPDPAMTPTTFGGGAHANVPRATGKSDNPDVLFRPKAAA